MIWVLDTDSREFGLMKIIQSAKTLTHTHTSITRVSETSYGDEKVLM